MALSSDKKIVRLIVEQCIANGMKHVVCSPGSRNAPLVISFDEHPDLKCYVVHDERSAAFMALGMAQQLGEPVGVVCTSGSAAANYYPAVVEAYYQCVPLIVLTADRPAAWIDQGDGQTIVQKGMFEPHVRYSCDLSEKMQDKEELWYAGRELAIAFSLATGNWKGPVHINIGLNEPLYGTADLGTHSSRQLQIESGRFRFSDRQFIEFRDQLEGARIMILCGQSEPNDRLRKELLAFSERSSVAVLVENTSNLQSAKFVHCIDRVLNTIRETEIEDFRPDILITIGGAVVSKRIKTFFRKYQPSMHWKVGFEFPYMDTYQCLTHSFQALPEDFFAELNRMDMKANQFNYGAKWKQKDLVVADRMYAFMLEAPYSDLLVFDAMLDYLPEASHLHMANSSVVRYCQLFDPIAGIRYWSNRGTSGIDGSTSTAVGASHANQKELHVLITGDVSFFYDSNALWNKYLGSNLRIILINNGGGGIFRIIPGPDTSPQLENYFEAAHDHQAEGLCRTFGVEYQCIRDLSDLESVMRSFYAYSENDRPKLLEIITPNELNSQVLKSFFQQTAD